VLLDVLFVELDKGVGFFLLVKIKFHGSLGLQLAETL